MSQIETKYTQRDILHKRGQANEAVYFHKHDAVLLERLRQQATLSEVVKALAEKLQVDNRGLLEQIMSLGVTLDTGAAFVLSPLVKVAWADGGVSDAERETIIRIAEARGIAAGSPDMTLLMQWLEKRPADDVYRLAVEAIRAAISVLPPGEAELRTTKMIALCEEVAEAPGKLRKLLGMPGHVSSEERTVLSQLAKYLSGQPASA